MQKILLILVLTLGASAARSQSILDLTEQLAIDVQKLASIKSTLTSMVQGYDRLKTGYTHIRDIAKDNFHLHQSFLDALWVVSPAVRSDPRLSAVLNTAAQLITGWQGASTRYAGNPVFTSQEQGYITATLQALLNHCNEAVEELTMVTTDDELRMSDAQRLQVLDRIAADVAADTAFLQHFEDSLAIEIARRQRETNDITTLKALYGLPD